MTKFIFPNPLDIVCNLPKEYKDIPPEHIAAVLMAIAKSGMKSNTLGLPETYQGGTFITENLNKATASFYFYDIPQAEKWFDAITADFDERAKLEKE